MERGGEPLDELRVLAGSGLERDLKTDMTMTDMSDTGEMKHPCQHPARAAAATDDANAHASSDDSAGGGHESAVETDLFGYVGWLNELDEMEQSKGSSVNNLNNITWRLKGDEAWRPREQRDPGHGNNRPRHDRSDNKHQDISDMKHRQVRRWDSEGGVSGVAGSDNVENIERGGFRRRYECLVAAFQDGMRYNIYVFILYM